MFLWMLFYTLQKLFLILVLEITYKKRLLISALLIKLELLEINEEAYKNYSTNLTKCVK